VITQVPCLLLDVSEAELPLATYDPIGDLAETPRPWRRSWRRSRRRTPPWLRGCPKVLSAALPSAAGFREYAPPAAWSSLAERFLVRPFSILDARQSYWQERKRQWLSLGLQSELGRDGNANKNQRYDQIDGEWLPGIRGKGGATGKNFAMNRLSGRLGRQWNETRSVVSIFDAVLCELAYRWFCPPGGLVIDPTAGGSVRGVIAGLLGRRYLEIELRTPQVQANREQWKAINGLVPRGDVARRRRSGDPTTAGTSGRM
jgi:hypothetical protein